MKAAWLRRSWLDVLTVAAGVAVCVSGAHAEVSALPPPPDTLSVQARTQLEAAGRAVSGGVAFSLAQKRAFAEQGQAGLGGLERQRYGVGVTEATLGGVPVRIISPQRRQGAAVLMNLHGGGFQVDSGSLTENIPLAALTGYEVIAVRYRLAPEHPFPAGVDDALAVYRALLKQHPASNIGVYGTSAGAIMVPELVRRLLAEHLALPGALGIFAGDGDLAREGDSAKLFAPPSNVLNLHEISEAYAGKRRLDDPAVSPLYGDLAGFPPTLCITSTRDFLLSSTATLCRKLDADGAQAKLIVFDGLPHAFWSYIQAPETDAAFAEMARFFQSKIEPASLAKAVSP